MWPVHTSCDPPWVMWPVHTSCDPPWVMWKKIMWPVHTSCDLYTRHVTRHESCDLYTRHVTCHESCDSHTSCDLDKSFNPHMHIPHLLHTHTHTHYTSQAEQLWPPESGSTQDAPESLHHSPQDTATTERRFHGDLISHSRWPLSCWPQHILNIHGYVPVNNIL